MFSTWERFHSATVELAGAGPIKRRLFGAYMNHLSALDSEQLPKEIREDFSSFTRAMRSVRPQPGEDAVRATVRKMSDLEANQYAVQIVNMLGTVSRVQMGTRPGTAAASVVQLYAAKG